MQRIQGLEQLAPTLTAFDVANPPSHKVGPGGGAKNNRTPMEIPRNIVRPAMIRAADMRPHTMKVLGKANPNAITHSRDPGVWRRRTCPPSTRPHTRCRWRA